jgi:UDP-GlcNAc:undecaprenyl-phosphate GlcNAc-1-phosphate transferase
MQQFLANPFAVGGFGLIASAALTLAVRAYAIRTGFVAKPKSDRWHQRPTAMLGGVAIFAAVLLIYSLFLEKTPESLLLLTGSSFLFLVGLLDDVLNIKPYQ